MEEQSDRRARTWKELLLVLLLLALMFGGGGAAAYWCFFGRARPLAVQIDTSPPHRAPPPVLAAPKRILAMCRDSAGNVWVGTEGQGVWRLDGQTQHWRSYTIADGLGDNFAFAIAADREGRIWVGHLNHGASVFAPSAGGAAGDGQWRNYEPVGGVSSASTLSGPIGPRVASIAVSPADGDVWIATNAGLTRYSETNDTWAYYTRENGLPCEFVRRIAFDASGNIFLATEYQGIAMAQEASVGAGTAWRIASGPHSPPLLPRGDGLPSNLIEDLLVARNGTIYAATDSGLGYRTDDGASWHFVRGQDWEKKARQRLDGVPAGWTPAPGAILIEDCCTSLAEDRNGKILVGHRDAAGVDQLDSMQEQGLWIFSDAQFVNCILATDRIMVGTENKGIDIEQVPPSPPPAPSATGATPAFPSGAPAPTLADLNGELSALSAIPPSDQTGPTAIELDDDFRVEGAWIGRFGRYAAILPGGAGRGADYVWGAGPTPMQCMFAAGPLPKTGGGAWRYTAALYSSHPLSVEIAPVYMDYDLTKHYTTPDRDRRETYVNDGGWRCGKDAEGPNLYLGAAIPRGEFVLSLYIPSGGGGARDYSLSVRPSPDNSPFNIEGFDQQPELATGRVQQWHGGWYQRFLVEGPENLTVRIERNHAIDTSVAAVMLDGLDEHPAPYYLTETQWRRQEDRAETGRANLQAQWAAGKRPSAAPDTDALSAAQHVLQRLRFLVRWNPRAWAYCHPRVAVELARWAMADAAGANPPSAAMQLKASSLYEAGYFEQWESAEESLGQRTTRAMEKSLKWDGKSPQPNGREFAVYGQSFTRPSTQP